MYELDLSTVKQWDKAGQFWRPRTLNTWCPHCGEKGTFTITNSAILNSNQCPRAFVLESHCATCEKPIVVFVANPGPADDKSRMGCDSLAIWPEPQSRREPIRDDSLLPARLKQQYHEAIGAYNAHFWSLGSGGCRMTLEAALKTLTGIDARDNMGLRKRLKDMAGEGELARPLKKLGDLVIDVANATIHFDNDVEPTQELVGVMLDLSEYLLEYAFMLPKLVDKAEAELEKALKGT